MKKQVLVIISIVIIASSFSYAQKLGTVKPGPFGDGVWDLADLNERIVDSFATVASTFDTIFAPHTQKSYQFVNQDSLIYTNYSVTPATIEVGHFTIIPGNKLIMIFAGNADTLDYTISIQENTLYLIRTTNIAHQLKISTELYSVRAKN